MKKSLAVILSVLFLGMVSGVSFAATTPEAKVIKKTHKKKTTKKSAAKHSTTSMAKSK